MDLNYYRHVYPELNNLPNDALTQHCKRFAVEQGRSTCIYDRREYLQAMLLDAINRYQIKSL